MAIRFISPKVINLQPEEAIPYLQNQNQLNLMHPNMRQSMQIQPYPSAQTELPEVQNSDEDKTTENLSRMI